MSAVLDRTPTTGEAGAPTPQPPPVRDPAGGLHPVSASSAMVAVVCLWLLVHVLVLGGLSQQRAQVTLYDDLRARLAAATAPTGGLIEPGAPVALLEIPSIGVHQVVVEGTASGDLLVGPGHRRDTALPGQAGVAVVYGRARTYGAPFARITELAPGDRITTVTGLGRTTFTVDDVRRAGDPLPAPAGVDAVRLTLVSGDGVGRFAAVTPSEVVYVDASASAEPQPTPAGRPAGVPPFERAMASDTTALPLLTLGLGTLCAVVVAVVPARRRWPAVVVWTVLTPVVVALAWWTSDIAVRLLPNLL